mmetsp:Transcript_22723/g.34366  ORF Transcript_22723/g.34366 Transcript_22723/m.34366 type:complete len:268 (-) Transcript_22723:102-905(-)|eukprot:CAMPEP_0178921612 /NCGR_PEP_ID=MMETSP0786-20121207/15663_1 /TAXON_ID=186022 /ORGANISM="Thalassionema frauenfeldii, Strain CCMP 1798" /LENGTH=267 /DNA_ID=CAMNT_0020595821 /DNA_START=17 /DNA_END=820 /DNA_ORIENTATION=+
MPNIIQSILSDPVILPSGATVLATHVFLTLIFKYLSPDGPWKQMPSYTAHQVVAFVMMIYQSYLGFYNFSGSGGVFEDNPGGIYISQFCIGTMLVWDIPVRLVSDGMGDPIMHAHHVGFFLMAAVTMGFFSPNGESLGANFAPFFFGMIELSSIPLQIVDLFHPKQKAWHAYMNQYPILKSLNEICRILFALLFVAMRAVAFPYITASSCIPDFWQASQERPEVAAPCISVMVANVLFTVLQLYWGFLLLKQIKKALMGGNKEEKKN